MDAALSEDNNDGGVIDSILITRNDYYRSNDFTLNATNKDSVVSLISGMIVFMEDPTQATVASNTSISMVTKVAIQEQLLNWYFKSFELFWKSCSRIYLSGC